LGDRPVVSKSSTATVSIFTLLFSAVAVSWRWRQRH
jgi:hypothetical protein